MSDNGCVARLSAGQKFDVTVQIETDHSLSNESDETLTINTTAASTSEQIPINKIYQAPNMSTCRSRQRFINTI